MVDVRPVGYLVGWLVTALGLSMALPLVADLAAGSANARVFATTAILVIVSGAVLAFACSSGASARMGVQESFLLATGTWAVFPIFGALPFWFGAPQASFTDAFFEAMSGLTTTGATVFTSLDTLPPGTLLWRGMLQWFGGLGIVIVAMVFLPTLKVGGMQIFRSEAFDTMGKILPRAGEIALSLSLIYALLTFLCFMAYVFTGMPAFDSAVHAMTTLATGGMANHDLSFSVYGASAHYVATAFMLLAALPFIRFLQFFAGDPKPIWRDPQIRGFLLVVAAFVTLLSAWLALVRPGPFEPAFREVLFNVVSIITGTGYSSADYDTWGSFAMTMFFVLGLIGGCSGSTACSVKIFRYQLMLASVSAEVKRLHAPNRVFAPRYDGHPVSQRVLDSVMAFFMFFFLTLAVVAVMLVLVGLDPLTAISGSATAIANIGPGLGPVIGPAGNFSTLPDAAKWILAATMLVGRLEILSVFVLFGAAFWRA
ncbi:MAG TPA: TrkH family potassium uptake protein [Amaricoccus sp.]|nr:TrkH family potassium uptake protein [Amaricoccus sp.]HMR52187.1 TrkH family potassium uptake protein [Amaricoccus sp.]HMR59516.1 TrkH family potassium uptake protein [Amaricoccus sp.]HMT99039.1 TrkH family potassium uptake protein [Amaricoccus sp.]